jgi:hypothetical protein
VNHNWQAKANLARPVQLFGDNLDRDAVSRGLLPAQRFRCDLYKIDDIRPVDLRGQVCEVREADTQRSGFDQNPSVCTEMTPFSSGGGSPWNCSCKFNRRPQVLQPDLPMMLAIALLMVSNVWFAGLNEIIADFTLGVVAIRSYSAVRHGSRLARLRQ